MISLTSSITTDEYTCLQNAILENFVKLHPLWPWCPFIAGNK